MSHGRLRMRLQPQRGPERDSSTYVLCASCSGPFEPRIQKGSIRFFSTYGNSPAKSACRKRSPTEKPTDVFPGFMLATQLGPRLWQITPSEIIQVIPMATSSVDSSSTRKKWQLQTNNCPTIKLVSIDPHHHPRKKKLI